LHVIISNAIIKSLKKINLKGKIKWPNDIYVNNKKIAGILIESFISGKKVQSSIVGIGINLNQKIFKGLNATSVFIEKKKVTKKNAFIKILKESLETEYFNFNMNMDIRIKKYKKLLYALNEIKKFKSSSEIFYAKITDVSHNGDIILNINDKQKSFSHGSISLLED
jgi:BirA family biotin operon repressor/biotin-[acetyl-CoA-carboxylase] ligase